MVLTHNSFKPQGWCVPESLGGVLVVALLTTLLLGCGANSGRYPVSGKVTLHGTVLETGSIQFLTTSGPPGPAAGAVITNGTYEIPEIQGLAPGKYRVLISSPEKVPGASSDPMAGGMPVTRERIPPSHNTESKVVVEVSALLPNRFDFTID